MRRLFLFTLPLLLVAAPAVFAQGILPASAAGWSSAAASNSTNSDTAGLQNLQQIAGPATAALKEYEIESAESVTYSHGGSDSFVAVAYGFKDTAGAYGAYSYLRTPDMAPASLTQHSSISSGRALALTGNLVLEFTGKTLHGDADAIELLVAEAGGHAHWGGYPALPQRLPTKDLIPRTDHFVWGPVALDQFLPVAQGDWLGLARGADAELARYRLEGRDATFVVADYPTPQMAAAQLAELETQLGVIVDDGKSMGASSAEASASPIYAHRDGTMIALVVNAPSQKAANLLLDRFHSGLVLTWNIPVIEKAQPSMVTIVIGTFYGAGEICLFTLGGGILFAGIRLLIKRMWPGRIFDRAFDLEIIELGLGSRPIKGSDLYQMRPPT